MPKVGFAFTAVPGGIRIDSINDDECLSNTNAKVGDVIVVIEGLDCSMDTASQFKQRLERHTYLCMYVLYILYVHVNGLSRSSLESS